MTWREREREHKPQVCPRPPPHRFAREPVARVGQRCTKSHIHVQFMCGLIYHINIFVCGLIYHIIHTNLSSVSLSHLSQYGVSAHIAQRPAMATPTRKVGWRECYTYVVIIHHTHTHTHVIWCTGCTHPPTHPHTHTHTPFGSSS